MNLQQIEYIIALDTYKSFSIAAEKCHITQATLSTMVKKLEEELDVVLFDRKTLPVITTDSGKEIIEQARRVLAHSNKLKQLASEIKGMVVGELKLGIIPTIAGNLLHRILPHLLEKYSALRLTIHETTTQQIINQLKRGELDAGIVSTPLEDNDLEEDILYYEKLLVYGQFKHKAPRYLCPNAIVKENVWLLEQGNCLSDQIISLCSLNPKKLNANLDFKPNSFESLIHIVDHLNGLTLIPELFYADLPAERKDRVTDFDAPYPVREVSLVYHRPYAKIRLIQAISKEIKFLISPLLQTSTLKNNQLLIANMVQGKKVK